MSVSNCQADASPLFCVARGSGGRIGRLLCLHCLAAFHHGRVGVCCGNTLYVLDETAGVDTDAVGEEHPIGGEFLSAFLDFGQPGAIKHIRHAQVTAQCESGAMTLLLGRADGQSLEVELAGDGEVLSLLHRRISMGRFRFLRVGFRTSGKGRARIFGLGITARS